MSKDAIVLIRDDHKEVRDWFPKVREGLGASGSGLGPDTVG